MPTVTTVAHCWFSYSQYHLGKTCDPATNRRRWNQLGWFSAKDAEGLTPMEVDAYVNFRGVQPATVNRELALLRACLRHAERHRLINRAPAIPVIPGARPRLRALSVEDAGKLIEAADQYGNWREMVYVRLALGTGARPGAIVDLTWDRVLPEVIDFRRPGNPRMKRRAVVPLSTMTKQALQIAQRHRQGPYVIHWEGKRLSSPRPLLRRLSARAGVSDCSPHVLRHTVASTLLAGGEDLLKVSRLLGHASTVITEQTYFQHPPAWLTDTTARLDFSKPSSTGLKPRSRHGSDWSTRGPRCQSGTSSVGRCAANGSSSATASSQRKPPSPVRS